MSQRHLNKDGLSMGNTGQETGCLSNEIALKDFPENEHFNKPKEEIQDNMNSSTSDSNHYTVKIFKDYKVSINKPLIPLKLTLFFWYGTGSFMPPFVTISYKQRGINLSELSSMTFVAPIFQLIGNSLSGIIADKIGRSKPVLVANILFILMTVVGILLMPKIESTHCKPYKINVFCNDQQSQKLTSQRSCDLQKDNFEVKNCEVHCPPNITKECNDNSLLCSIITRTNLSNISLNIYVEKIHVVQMAGSCMYNINAVEYEYANGSWCHSIDAINCSVTCDSYTEGNRCEQGSFDYLTIAYAVLFVLFLVFYSNCYRCMEVTCMVMAKEHNSDFGHERAFAILGHLVIPPIAGYFVEVTTPPGNKMNCSAALYLFLTVNSLLFVILYHLPVRINAPGKKLWKKSLSLIKHIDVVMFLIVIFILGISWNFVTFFLIWYLEDLDAPGVLIGLITSVSALYGLPFLLTSKWFVRKMGSNRIIVLAFLGYVINSAGYSALQNPWFALALEATGIITYHLLWVAVSEYCHDIAPDDMKSTIMSVAGAVHFSFGKVTTGFTGGYIMNHFGGRAAFRFNAILSLTFAVIYTVFLCIRRRFI